MVIIAQCYKHSSYTLSNGESIQMVTALVLQLIQCIIKVPEAEEKKEPVRDLEPKEQKMDQVTLRDPTLLLFLLVAQIPTFTKFSNEDHNFVY